MMIDLIGTVMADKLLVKLNNVKFFNLLFDGSTDAAMLEKEVSYLQYFDPTPLASDEVKLYKNFLLYQKSTTHADGVKKNHKGFLRKES